MQTRCSTQCHSPRPRFPDPLFQLRAIPTPHLLTTCLHISVMTHSNLPSCPACCVPLLCDSPGDRVLPASCSQAPQASGLSLAPWSVPWGQGLPHLPLPHLHQRFKHLHMKLLQVFASSSEFASEPGHLPGSPPVAVAVTRQEGRSLQPPPPPLMLTSHRVLSHTVLEPQADQPSSCPRTRVPSDGPNSVMRK